MDSRRIVVTGMGVVSPLGCGVVVVWHPMLAGRSGLRNLPDAVVADLPARVGGRVPTQEEDAEAGFDPDRATAPLAGSRRSRPSASAWRAGSGPAISRVSPSR